MDGSQPERSPEENARQKIAAYCKMLRGSIGRENTAVNIRDTETPKKYTDDPDRTCWYRGVVLEVSDDIEDPWVVIQVTSHRIQMTSYESVMPGFSGFFRAMFTEYNDDELMRAVDELDAAAKEHPDVHTWFELEVPQAPIRVPVTEDSKCIVSSVKFLPTDRQ